MRDKAWYPIAFMFVITAFFCSILIILARATEKLVESNQKLALEKAVLMALPLNISADMPSSEIHKIYESKIKEPSDKNKEAFLYIENNAIAGYAIHLQGQGFWDKIKGIIGVKPDKSTITGVYFYEQNETPGLGAEITQLPFRSQFAGKKIAGTGNPFGIKPPSANLTESEVHAITGATQTSVRLEKIINNRLTQWRDNNN